MEPRNCKLLSHDEYPHDSLRHGLLIMIRRLYNAGIQSPA